MLQHSYPLLSFGATAKLRFDALKKDYSYCDYTFSNVKIAFSTATDASVGADVVEACKPTIAVPAKPLNAVMQFTLQKAANGDMDRRERGRTELRRFSADVTLGAAFLPVASMLLNGPRLAPGTVAMSP